MIKLIIYLIVFNIPFGGANYYTGSNIEAHRTYEDAAIAIMKSDKNVKLYEVTIIYEWEKVECIPKNDELSSIQYIPKHTQTIKELPLPKITIEE